MSLPLVLIVDDNPQNLTVIGELLQPQHAVRVANSGRRALQLARLAPQPDLILLDVMMPEMDGYEVLCALRAASDTAAIPVVFLTALNGSDDEERGLKLGAADYITKPIRPQVLLARVRAQLAQKQTRDAVQLRQAQLDEQLALAQARCRHLEAVAMQAIAELAPQAQAIALILTNPSRQDDLAMLQAFSHCQEALRTIAGWQAGEAAAGRQADEPAAGHLPAHKSA